MSLNLKLFILTNIWLTIKSNHFYNSCVLSIDFLVLRNNGRTNNYNSFIVLFQQIHKLFFCFKIFRLYSIIVLLLYRVLAASPIEASGTWSGMRIFDLIRKKIFRGEYFILGSIYLRGGVASPLNNNNPSLDLFEVKL